MVVDEKQLELLFEEFLVKNGLVPQVTKDREELKLLQDWTEMFNGLVKEFNERVDEVSKKGRLDDIRRNDRRSLLSELDTFETRMNFIKKELIRKLEENK